MFDLFTQGDRSLARSQGGLGIGLTLVRTLVELHGGTVTATSGGTGRGASSSSGSPPLEDRPRPLPSRREDPRTRPFDASGCSSSRTDVDTANGMAEAPEALGRRCRGSPTAARRRSIAAREHRPEVMLLDIGLPGMDGYELASRLRQEECGRDTVLIAVYRLRRRAGPPTLPGGGYRPPPGQAGRLRRVARPDKSASCHYVTRVPKMAVKSGTADLSIVSPRESGPIRSPPARLIIKVSRVARTSGIPETPRAPPGPPIHA